MMEPSRVNTVLFTDIVGSSLLYNDLGNQKAQQKIHLILTTLTECVSKFRGHVVKTIGDEIMCVFTLLDDALECASEMNRLCEDHLIELRTGISSGLLIEQDNDFFGDTVNNAAFLTKVARAREILIDQVALDQNECIPTIKIELIAEMTVKGMSDPSKIYRINWEHALSQSLDATMISQINNSFNSTLTELNITYHDQIFSINSDNPVFIIGRDRHSATLTINHANISRRHCSIELKSGKYILNDHSTNGTYVTQHNSSPTLVHRESFALIGEGHLLFDLLLEDVKDHIYYKMT